MRLRIPLYAWMLKFRHFAAATGILVLLAWAGLNVIRYEASSSRAVIFSIEEAKVPILTTGPWWSKNEDGECEPHTVSTQKLASETNEEWTQRHKDAVRAAKAAFPVAEDCP